MAQFVISVDSLTKGQMVTQYDFWADTLYILGLIGIFAATCTCAMVSVPLPPLNILSCRSGGSSC